MSIRSNKPKPRKGEDVLITTGVAYATGILGYVKRFIRMIYRALYRSFIFPIYFEFLKIHNDILAKIFTATIQILLLATLAACFYLSFVFGLIFFIVVYLIGSHNAYELDGRGPFEYLKEQWYLLDYFYKVSKKTIVEKEVFTSYERKGKRK